MKYLLKARKKMIVRVEFKGDIPSIDYTPMEMEDTDDIELIKERIIKEFGKEPVAFTFVLKGRAYGYRDWDYGKEKEKC